MNINRLCLVIVLTTLTFASCSKSALNWPPMENDTPLLIIGPKYKNNTEEPYGNIKLLTDAISKASGDYISQKKGENDQGFNQIEVYNWILDSRKLGFLWRQIEKSLTMSNPQDREQFLKTSVINYFEEHEFQGFLLALRFSPVLKSQMKNRHLEGFRLIYFSPDEMEFNFFKIPVLLEGSGKEVILREPIKHLISSLEYSSASLERMGFSRVEEGCFLAGDDLLEEECTDEFYFGRFPVTQRQWGDVMNATNPDKNRSSRTPAINVSWSDIERFLEILNDESDHHYRLPTGLEWEYACRAGGKTIAYGTLSGSISAGEANYTDVKEGIMSKGISTVDYYPPNRIGLYDMTGNTWEWTLDQALYNDREGFFGSLMRRFSKIPKKRTVRGGSFDSTAQGVRCSSEQLVSESIGSPDMGFRLVME